MLRHSAIKQSHAWSISYDLNSYSTGYDSECMVVWLNYFHRYRCIIDDPEKAQPSVMAKKLNHSYTGVNR